MPRNQRIKKDGSNNKQNNLSMDDFLDSYDFTSEEGARSFAVDFQRALVNSPVYWNPIWRNEILKDINMHPSEYSRDKVEELLKNPRDNEQALRNLAQYLDNFIMQFKRMVDYFAKILTFDYVIFPTNADEVDMKKSTFKTSEKKAKEFLEKFDVKSIGIDVMKMVMLEDAKYYYLRESDQGYSLQEMPSDFCKIWSKNDLGYQYAFDLTYFFRPGVDFNDFAPEFRDYYEAFINGDEYKKNKNAYQGGQYYYWQKLDPSKACVFKFNENVAGSIPPLAGLFVDSVEIASYKQLIKAKTKLETWKLLINKIATHKDSKTGSSVKNNFSIDADIAATFTKMMQDRLPEGVVTVTTPFDETKAFDFSQGAQSRDSIVGIGQQNFYDSVGTSATLFGEKNTNGSGIANSIKTDENFVMHMYRQFERFMNYQLSLRTGRYRWKVVFLDLTRFNWQDKHKIYLQSAQYGYPKTLVTSAMGIRPFDAIDLMKYENSLDMPSYMIPLSSSHVQNGANNSTNEGGRPLQDNLTDEGQKTRDLDANNNR